MSSSSIDKPRNDSDAQIEEVGKPRADTHDLNLDDEERDVFAATEDGPAFRSLTV